MSALSKTKQRRIRALRARADSADVAHGSAEHKILLRKIKQLRTTP